jgi:TatD DNase family protein
MIDTHAHLTFSKFREEEIFSIIERAKENNVEYIINICTDPLSLKKSLILQKTHKNIFTAAATTPHDVEKEGEEFFKIVEKLANEKQLIAIGETGLDYYYKHSKIEIQKKFFKKYINLAEKTSLPLIIHCRDAFSDLFNLMENFKGKVVLHCFTGSLEDAKKALKGNFFISFSGIITFKNSKDLQETLKFTPLNNILIETDTPYLAPQKYRGKTNEPAFLIEIAKKIAELKNISLKEVIEKTTKNAKSLFSI